MGFIFYLRLRKFLNFECWLSPASQSVKKIIEINPYMLGTMAGGAADCQFWHRNLGIKVIYATLNHLSCMLASVCSLLLFLDKSPTEFLFWSPTPCHSKVISLQFCYWYCCCCYSRVGNVYLLLKYICIHFLEITCA